MDKSRDLIGNARIKGNSHEVLGCHVREDETRFKDGIGVVQRKGRGEKNVVILGDSNINAGESFLGFAFGLNDCTKRCSVITRGFSIPLPCADPAGFSEGDQVIVNSTTGLIDAAGDLLLNAKIVNAGLELEAYNRKGAVIDNIVFIDLFNSMTTAVVATAAKDTKKQTAKA